MKSSMNLLGFETIRLLALLTGRLESSVGLELLLLESHVDCRCPLVCYSGPWTASETFCFFYIPVPQVSGRTYDLGWSESPVTPFVMS